MCFDTWQPVAPEKALIIKRHKTGTKHTFTQAFALAARSNM